jgi:hypothetical protein
MMDDIEAVILKVTLVMTRQDHEVQMKNSGQTNDVKQHTCGIYAYCFVQRFQNVQGCR